MSDPSVPPGLLPVYLVHFGAPDWCASATRSVLASLGCEVALTVIDNGPAGCGLAERLPDRVRRLEQPANLGYTGGANAALRDAADRFGDSPFVVVGSHDLHVAPDTLRRLLEVATARAAAGIVAPLLTAPDARAGGRWTGVRSLQLAPDVGSSPIVERDWVSGTCMLLRRSMVDRVGLFDERFGSYMEDVDYGLRARDHGFEVLVVTDAHAHGLGTASDRSIDLITANTVLLNAKRRGIIGILHSVGLFSLWAVRSSAGWLAPWRGATERAVSRRYARGRLRGLGQALRGGRLRAALEAHTR